VVGRRRHARPVVSVCRRVVWGSVSNSSGYALDSTLVLAGDGGVADVEDYPRTIALLESRYTQEGDCLDCLFALRWPDGFCCPNCTNGRAWRSLRGCFVLDIAGKFPFWLERFSETQSFSIVGSTGHQRRASDILDAHKPEDLAPVELSAYPEQFLTMDVCIELRK
jgi:Transposase zinc-ribbon domain